MKGKFNRRGERLRSLLVSLLLCGGGLIVVTPSLALVGCSEDSGVTGDKPAPDAEMKSVIINVFGMT